MRGIAPAGFVLVGGKSLRMGESKALLPYRGGTLAQHMAELLFDLAHPISFVGDPAIYGHLGYATIADAAPDRGPLSGIESALLSDTAAEWNFILACDIPDIEPAFLRQLGEQTVQAPQKIDCIVPQTTWFRPAAPKDAPARTLQPLCAVYRRRCGLVATAALAKGTRRVVDFVAMLQADICPVQESLQFRNVNTRPEWDSFLASTSK